MILVDTETQAAPGLSEMLLYALCFMRQCLECWPITVKYPHKLIKTEPFNKIKMLLFALSYDRSGF